MLVLDIVQKVSSGDVGSFEDGVQAHLVMVELSTVDCQVFHDCIVEAVLIIGGSKLMARRFGENEVEIGLRTSFFEDLEGIRDIGVFRSSILNG